MSDWFCLKCDFVTDVFKNVWDHCKGQNHIMQMKQLIEVGLT